MMKTLWTFVTAVLFALAMSACSLQTAPEDATEEVSVLSSVHLKGGKKAEPTFMDGGLTLRTDGEMAGLGNGDVHVTLAAEADVTSTCTNQGGNQAPGQNPAPLTVLGAAAIPAAEVKNGNTPFSVETESPDPVIAGAPDCPNPNWTERIDDLAFTSSTMTVEQPPGTVVLVVACIINPPSQNEEVPKNDVVCTQN